VIDTRATLQIADRTYSYYSLKKAEAQLGNVTSLPLSLKVLLENLLRFEDGVNVTRDDIVAIVDWPNRRSGNREIQYRPARVLMQDFTAVPCLVDLAAMREAISDIGGDPNKVNPQVPVDIVVDHSLMVDYFGNAAAMEMNVGLEFARNAERYEFLKWGAKAFTNLRVVPPGTGICHQVNLEYLARGVWSADDGTGAIVAYPDTLVGTDSHTTMINGMGVLGWGVGGIEAEAVMLGQPLSMLIPEVLGVELTGQLREGITATDLVLTITELLRGKNVVGRFVEFYGLGLDVLTLADRATIANMAPEYGATCAFFPIDNQTLAYLRLTGRSEEMVTLVEAYCKVQGMWRDASTRNPVFTETISLNLSSVQPSVAGPKRPQDRVPLGRVEESFDALLRSRITKPVDLEHSRDLEQSGHQIADGDVVIAAITSCTNTSNPSVMIAAGLLARKAREKGLSRKPWTKTSLAPGSQIVTDYLEKTGLQDDLDALGFNLVGYGCSTCCGNSGPLAAPISAAINEQDLVAVAVLSGNRNFEGRISADVRANFLTSPPLVVAYALTGTVRTNMIDMPIGQGSDGLDVYLKDIWPSNAEVLELMDTCVTRDLFAARYGKGLSASKRWLDIDVPDSATYQWHHGSTYIANPPYFDGLQMTSARAQDIIEAKPLAIFGDSITTDHISPAGSIMVDSPAGTFLQERQVSKCDFNSYGSRRGNHEVMLRGTFANIRIRNEMLASVEGGMTMYKGRVMSIYDAAMCYKLDGTALVIIAGKEYGTGSSRDWAAKGTNLLGVRAVITESYERIHRSNLVGMGVLPLEFADGVTRETLKLDGSETFTIKGIADLQPRQTVEVTLIRADGKAEQIMTYCRIDTVKELEYFLNGGILKYVLRALAS